MMGAFSVASVIGVPFALECAQLGGWRAPFWVVAGLGLLIVAGAGSLFPSLRGHIEAARITPAVGPMDLLRRPTVLASYAMTAAVMMAGCLVIPNI